MLASMLTGCTDPPAEEFSQVCVDDQDVRVPDEQCEDEDHAHGHWFYSGSAHASPPIGSKINCTHGSFTAPTGNVKVSRVATGGFGGRSTGGGS